MVDYFAITEAERELRNMEAVRLAHQAHVTHLQAIGLLPAVVRLHIEEDAPKRRALERIADPNAYEID